MDLPIGYCRSCDGPGIKKCGQCQLVRYCSVECQRKDWPNHKLICSKKKELMETISDEDRKYGIYLSKIHYYAVFTTVFNHMERANISFFDYPGCLLDIDTSKCTYKTPVDPIEIFMTSSFWMCDEEFISSILSEYHQTMELEKDTFYIIIKCGNPAKVIGRNRTFFQKILKKGKFTRISLVS